MKLKYLSLIFIILFYNCTDSNEEQFLNNFKEEKEYRKDVVQGRTKQISSNDLYILSKTEAINEFEFDREKIYFYGYKSKLNSDSYLLTYNVYYVIPGGEAGSFGGGGREYLCIYQKGIGIVSKIKIFSKGSIYIYPEVKNGIYSTISNTIVYKFKETKEGNLIYQEQKELISKYKIENNRFVKLK